MTRKHFERIASIIRKFPAETYGWSAKETLAKEFIQMFEEDNPNFDDERFIKACGIGITEV